MILIGIATRSSKNATMQISEQQLITTESGLTGDYRRPPSNRQVTILSRIQWQKACTELGIELPWTARRANLLIDGIEFDSSMIGRTIYIGDVELLICGETEPCHKMDQFHQGLKQALMPSWRGGVCCKVVAGGQIRIGSKVAVR